MLLYVKKYKSDIIYLSLFTFIFLLVAIMFFQRQSDLLNDCGREAYLAQEVMRGKVLYKDLLNIYGPLSYQLNAFFFKLFGLHLNTLFIVGNFIAYGIALTIYFIARFFTTEFLSFSFAVFTTVIGVASSSVFNFVFPYTFAMTYALLAVLLSIVLMLMHFKTSKWYFLPLSFFFLGFSLTSKLDFAGQLFVLITYSLFVTRVSFKKHILNIIAFLVVPVFSWGALFAKGLTLTELFVIGNLYTKIISSESSRLFSLRIFGLLPYFDNLFKNFVTFIINIFLFFTLGFILYNVKIRTKSKAILFGLFIVVAQIISWTCSANEFVLIVPLLCCFLILLVIKNIKNLRAINHLDLSFILLLTTSILLASRNFFYIGLYAPYGLFVFPLLFLAGIVFIATYLPQYIKLKDNNAFINILAVLVLLISSNFFILFSDSIFSSEKVKLNTQKGTIYISEDEYNIYQRVVKSCSKIPNGNRLLILPESPIINFFLDKESDPFYYSLFPPFIEAYGEDKIIEDLRKRPNTSFLIIPDPIVIWNKKHFCYDYGQKICKYIMTPKKS